ncbi:hypothetical protein C2845_PM12G22770 [Panicum miliaceum]|uniref:Uncharacterized protein n=1 Tax=Panicum miliaceum TaxID=4540 RepID=A0A3L6QG00_PANMI|nr:hypothetical protein C2845_PM12G22770 [Panicum miliaceum]
MAQVWAVSLAVASLAIGMLGVLGVWLCYLFDAVALGPCAPDPAAHAMLGGGVLEFSCSQSSHLSAFGRLDEE